ncbi:MAG: hypothetical protein NVSMB52_19110 [Chloroflexota bacterium]
MTIDSTHIFDQQVLATIRQLMASRSEGVSTAETISLMDKDGSNADDVAVNVPLAVERLRRGGLLMSNLSGHLRLTSAGQKQMPQSDVTVDSANS